MTETQAAWVAGILDGEGTLGVYITGGVPIPVLTVRNTSEKLVRVLHQYCGVGSVRFQAEKRVKNKDVWAWRVTRREDVAKLVVAVFPYLVAKAPQAALLAEFVAVEPQRRYSVEDAALRERIRLQLRQHNRVGRMA